MSEVVIIIDKFLKRKLKMNSENEQFWQRVYNHHSHHHHHHQRRTQFISGNEATHNKQSDKQENVKQNY